MQSNEIVGIELVGCPQCHAPAEVTDRFVLESTDGPLEHVTVRCAQRHWFTMLTERLPRAAQRSPARSTGSNGHDGTGPGRWTPASSS